MILQRLTKTSGTILGAFRHRRRGFSVLELSIAITAFSGIGAFAASLAVLSGRQLQRTAFNLPAETNSFRLMDHARYKLLSAQAGRIATNNPNEVVFTNATTGKKSVLKWDKSDDQNARGLFYQEERNISDWVHLGGSHRIENCTFEVDARGRQVTVVMVQSSKDARGNQNKFSREEVITARN